MLVEHDGIELNVEIDGAEDGPPVVFLHGVFGCALTWGWLPPEITEGRRIIKVDLRGHGASGHAPGTYVIEHYGPDLVEILRQVAGRPAVLVGHSLGGSVAWWVAQRHPELVAAALLEDPPLYMGEPGANDGNDLAAIFPMLRDRARGWQENGVDSETAAAELATSPAGPGITLGDVQLPEGLLTMAKGQLLMDPGVLTAAADGSALSGIDLVSPVEVPVLLLAAGVAPVFTPPHAERLAQTHPGVEVVRIEGAGHGIHDEIRNRSVFTEHLAAFLARHAPAGAAVQP
jgi:esterase